MLTRRDLEQIRAIVRDEIARALRDQPVSATAGEPESADDVELARERAREYIKLLGRSLGGDRRAKGQLQQLHARERVHQPWWVQRARRVLDLEPSAAVTEADMLRTIELWEQELERRAEQRKQQKQRRDR